MLRKPSLVSSLAIQVPITWVPSRHRMVSTMVVLLYMCTSSLAVSAASDRRVFCMVTSM